MYWFVNIDDCVAAFFGLKPGPGISISVSSVLHQSDGDALPFFEVQVCV